MTNYRNIYKQKFKEDLQMGAEVPWLKFEEFLDHINKCKSCETCSVWCEYCKKDVKISKLEKHN